MQHRGSFSCIWCYLKGRVICLCFHLRCLLTLPWRWHIELNHFFGEESPTSSALESWVWISTVSVTWISWLRPQTALGSWFFLLLRVCLPYISRGDRDWTFLTMMSLILQLFSINFLWRASPLCQLSDIYHLRYGLASGVHSTTNSSDIHLEREAARFVTYLVVEWMNTMCHRIHILAGKIKIWI